MHFVFVHGWGFNPAIWRDVIRNIGNADVSLVDLGFISGGPKVAATWPSDAIAVGHSLGLLWLLHRAGRRAGRLSVGSSASRASTASVRISRRRGSPACGAGFAVTQARPSRPSGAAAARSPSPRQRPSISSGSTRGLAGCWTGMRAGEGRAACPTLALAARDDAVVPQAMSEAIWGSDTIRWSETGGHVLPLKHPEWCARHVLDFAHALQP